MINDFNFRYMRNNPVDHGYAHIKLNKNAVSSVESRLLVDTIRSEEANRARAFVPRGGEGGGFSAYESGGDARRLPWGCKFRILVSVTVFWAKRYYI